MRGHSVSFHLEIRKIISELSLLPLLVCSTECSWDCFITFVYSSKFIGLYDRISDLCNLGVKGSLSK